MTNVSLVLEGSKSVIIYSDSEEDQQTEIFKNFSSLKFSLFPHEKKN